MTAAWICSLVVRDIPKISQFGGYPKWFVFEVMINGPAGVLELAICLVIAGIITLLVARPRVDLSKIWGAVTPFSLGLAWALGVGVLLGSLMMFGTHHA